MPAQTFTEHVAIVAAESPRGLVLDWWRRLDMILDDYFVTRCVQRPMSRAAVEKMIAADGRLPEGLGAEIQRLRLERNCVAHEVRVGLGQEEVTRYADRAFAAIGAFSMVL
ncbi:MAG: hypothetical protein GEU90_20950 [Gemmatimonas sp.]|nr:hypothetical protein [Gemmatimonas sp.]